MTNMSGSVADYNKWRKAQGMDPVSFRRKKIQRSVTLSDLAYDGLYQLAKQYGLLWGGRVSISDLIERIGMGEFEIRRV
jgi:hypothetical protein